MAPDPDTRTPKYKPPPGACDAHCHIFGPGDKYSYAPDRSYTPPDAPLEKFQALQKTLGLSRAVLVNASCHGVDNTVILDAIEQSGGRYRGVANVDESFSDEDFADLHAGGIRGIRFNFVQHLGGTPDLDEFQRLVARAAEFDWHVVLHSMRPTCFSSTTCCARCPCRSSSTTWAECRPRTASSRSRSRSC
jgi:predicted TIM-barrel fold metal-dependent hydrolase